MRDPKYDLSSLVKLRVAIIAVLVLLAGVLLVSAPAQAQNYGTPVTLHAFQGYDSGDGATPVGGLTIDSNGFLYGATTYGGSAGYGTIFEVDPNDSQAPEMLLYSFSGGLDGAAPVSRIVFGQDGNLYGTTAAGETDDCLGIGGCGTVFTMTRLAPPCDPYCDWALTTIYSFDKTYGSDPYGDLVFDSANNIYGTTRYGGNGGGIITELNPTEADCMANNSSATTYGCGTVFEIDYHGGRHPSWTTPPTLLWQFDSSSYAPSCGLGSHGLDGIEPYGGVVFDASGNLLGSTLIGGQSGSSYYGYGTVFQLTPPGTMWTEQVLKNLDGGTAGSYSFTTLSAQTRSGPFYGGAADGGGSNEDGTIFDLTAGASCGNWSFGLVKPVGQGTGTDLDVQGPRGNLVLVSYQNNPNLYLYGTQTTGGTHNEGAVFQMVYSNGSWGGSNHDLQLHWWK